MIRIHPRLTLAAALTLALSACAATTGSEATEDTETATAEATASVEAESTSSAGMSASDDPGRESAMDIDELTKDPETFLGQQIYVTAEVDEELDDDHAFTLSGIDESATLLVVNQANVVFQEIDDDDLVAVKGTLVEFDAQAMQDAGADVTPDDEALADYDGEHVLVASAVEQTDED
jgi:hypothetical protein